MPKLSQDAKVYLRTLLVYAEGAEGFQERMEIEFGAEDTDEYCEKMGAVSSEIWALLED